MLVKADIVSGGGPLLPSCWKPYGFIACVNQRGKDPSFLTGGLSQARPLPTTHHREPTAEEVPMNPDRASENYEDSGFIP